MPPASVVNLSADRSIWSPDSGAGSGITELVQTGVVNAEEVGDFVYDGDADFAHHVLLGIADCEDRVAVDEYMVRHRAAIRGITFGEWNPFIKTEEVRVVVGRVVLDEEDHVVEQPAECGGDCIERCAREFVETVLAHDYHDSSLPDAEDSALSELMAARSPAGRTASRPT